MQGDIMSNEHESYEKEYDDHVYEDDYYEEHYDEEELVDDDDLVDDDAEDLEANEKKIHVSYACEDCDYRWDDVIIKKKDDYVEEVDEADVICPMCGSLNIEQI